MKNLILFFASIICVSIFFYPSSTNSNTTGSPGGKTGSPVDGQTCTQCHVGNVQSNNNIAWITTNIPNSGYSIGNTYTITIHADGDAAGTTKYGFELTAESNFIKSGDFFITDNTTKLVNANTAITHQASGTNVGTAGTLKQWSVDWTPTSNSIDSTTIYAAIMLTNNNGNNSGDIVYTTNTTVLENQITSVREVLNNEFIFNPLNKSIISNNPVKIYNLKGNLVLESKGKSSDLSELKSGVYIIKSLNTSQKIILN